MHADVLLDALQMFARDAPFSMLKLHPVRYDWDLLKRALRPRVSWAAKEAEMSKLEEIALSKIAASKQTDELETLEYFLGQVQAAKMICQANGLLEAYERGEKDSPALKKRLVDAVGQRPVSFCEVFWMFLGANGERKVVARGNMRIIEDRLGHGLPSMAPEHQVAEVFSFLMNYSGVAENDPDVKPIADETLSRLIHGKLVPHFSHLSTVPPSERRRALKGLRALLIAGFDAACRNNEFDLHGGRKSIEWGGAGAEIKKVLPAWAAIQHAKAWLAEHLELPTKGELAERMRTDHPELSGLKQSSWSRILAEAGLSKLPECKPWELLEKKALFSGTKFSENRATGKKMRQF